MEIPRRTLLAGLTAGPAAIAGAQGQAAQGQAAQGQAAHTQSAAPADLLANWTDEARQRVVPVRIRFPATPGQAPVVIISHGLGGSRDGLAYLGLALANAGFLVVHPQHLGTDSAVWRGNTDPVVAMAAAVMDIRRAMDRLRDVAYVLDRLGQGQGLLGAQADLSRIGIAGHSFGAWTVTHMLGERLPGGGFLEAGLGVSLPDARLHAGVALSPVPPLGMPAAGAFDRVTAPILHVTGTEDRGVIEAATPADRFIPYRASAAPGVLAVLGGASHASFAGEPGIGPRWNDPTYQPRVASMAVLFLRATLLRDKVAAALVQRGAPLSPGDHIEARGVLA